MSEHRIYFIDPSSADKNRTEYARDLTFTRANEMLDELNGFNGAPKAGQRKLYYWSERVIGPAGEWMASNSNLHITFPHEKNTEHRPDDSKTQDRSLSGDCQGDHGPADVSRDRADVQAEPQDQREVHVLASGPGPARGPDEARKGRRRNPSFNSSPNQPVRINPTFNA